MAPVESAVIQQEIHIEAEPEVVFSHFTDPERMVRWMGISAELDPRPGGAFRVDINDRDVALGEFVEVEPHRRVVFTWGWQSEDSPTPPGSSTVEIALTPQGASTLLRLVHRDLPAESQAAHDHGWQHYFERLQTAAAGGDPGADPWSTPEGADAGAPEPARG